MEQVQHKSILEHAKDKWPDFEPAIIRINLYSKDLEVIKEMIFPVQKMSEISAAINEAGK